MDKNLPINLQRRRFLGQAGALAGTLAFGAYGGLVAGCGLSAPLAGDAALGLPPQDVAALLADLEQRSFRFFWDTTDPATGLAPDRWPTPSFASVAAVGFALTAYPVGVARGWVTREQARQRVLATLRFFRHAPQGPEPAGNAGYKGFFYHFLDMKTGARFAQVELSTVDTALFVAGALFCASWFNGADAGETEIRTLADEIYARVDWRWAQVRAPALCLGWKPETGFLPEDYKGYNEAMLLYLLALGSPSLAVDATAWDAWTSTYDRAWGSDYGQEHLRYPVMFTHQFTQCWVDLRGVQDAYMRRRGIDYFENSRRATQAQRAYAIANPERWAGYGADVWGLTACDGPVDIERDFGGKRRRFISYAGRGMGGGLRNYDDGTVAPYGAGASLPFAPEIVAPTLAAMHQRHGAHIYGRYGFFAFNQSFTYTDVKLTHGRVVPGFGWVDTDYLGIEVGPLLAMLANHRGELVWKAMRGNEHLRRGLQRAGFRGGWLG
ncbi:MAG: glucoamylase family protein [Rubrivivax sp.]|nr:glucoamylase family protein [Rubrivivax sp.]